LLPLVPLVVSSCASTRSTVSQSALGDDAITIASFDFPESALLAEAYGQAIQSGGYHVSMRERLGPRELVIPALRQGLVEFVPEYAGTGLRFASPDGVAAAGDTAATHSALERALANSPIAALDAAPAQDTNVFAVTAATAAEHGLSSISQLGDHAGQLSLGGPPECPNRPFCLQGLHRVYGIEFKKFVALDAGGALSRQALETGGVDVALLFSTDPHITADGLVVLADDRALQPSENITPLIHKEILDRFGANLRSRVDAVSRLLTTEELQDMNAQVDRGLSPEAVAAQWLARHGLT
jgi:osmoprotectant transport system substrate-binding protein